MRRYDRLLSRLYDTPLMVRADRLAHLARIMETKILKHEEPVIEGILYQHEDPSAVSAAYRADERSDPRMDLDLPYLISRGNIAVVPLTGTLISRDTGSWMSGRPTSYTDIRQSVEAALSDDRVRGILLDIDSPGGEVGGLFELTNFLLQAKAKKPMAAIANHGAYSAAYAIASTAARIFVTRAGGVGSVGVVALHMDESEADKKEGYKFTAIYAGKRKVDFNSHFPLTDSAREIIQSQVDQLYMDFVSLVARQRSIPEEKVRGTEAGIFLGPKAVESWLADQEGGMDAALDYMGAVVSGRVTVGAAAGTVGVAAVATAPTAPTTSTVPSTTSATSVTYKLHEEEKENEMVGTAGTSAVAGTSAAETTERVEERVERVEAPAQAPAPAQAQAPAQSPAPTPALITAADLIGLFEVAGIPLTELKAHIGRPLTHREAFALIVDLKAAMATDASPAGTSTSGNTQASNRIRQSAEEYAKSHNITVHKAYSVVLRTNPGLYDQYLAENPNRTQRITG